MVTASTLQASLELTARSLPQVKRNIESSVPTTSDGIGRSLKLARNAALDSAGRSIVNENPGEVAYHYGRKELIRNNPFDWHGAKERAEDKVNAYVDDETRCPRCFQENEGYRTYPEEAKAEARMLAHGMRKGAFEASGHSNYTADDLDDLNSGRGPISPAKRDGTAVYVADVDQMGRQTSSARRRHPCTNCGHFERSNWSKGDYIDSVRELADCVGGGEVSYFDTDAAVRGVIQCLKDDPGSSGHPKQVFTHAVARGLSEPQFMRISEGIREFDPDLSESGSN